MTDSEFGPLEDPTVKMAGLLLNPAFKDRRQFRIVVCGSRYWTDREVITSVLRLYMGKFSPLSLVVIHGGARGADTLAGEVALELGLGIEVFEADWHPHGQRETDLSAGPRRNARMLHDGRPDLVLAFTDDLEESKGTRHTISLCVLERIPFLVFGHGQAPVPGGGAVVRQYDVPRHTPDSGP